MNFNAVTLNETQTLAITGGRGRKRGHGKGKKGNGEGRAKFLAKLTDLGLVIPEDATKKEIRDLIKDFREANKPVNEG